MSNEPLVSVLMTAYNREKYVAEAIESVLASTFEDFELIIVDDASQDKTVEIARQYLSDSRVQIHVNEQNRGDYSNRNQAASFAKGKYLKYLDSDDIIYPFGLETMVDGMERFPEAGLGICRPASASGPYPMKIEPEQAYREHFLQKGLFTTGPSGCIIRTEIFQELNGFSGKRHVGDTELWLRISEKYPIIKLMKDLIWWRIHPEQENQKRNSHITYSYTLSFQIELAALKKNSHLFSSWDFEQAIRRLRYWQTRRILRLALREGQLRAASRLYRASGLSIGDLLNGLAHSAPQYTNMNPSIVNF